MSLGQSIGSSLGRAIGSSLAAGDGVVGGSIPVAWDWTPGTRVAIAFYGDSITLGAYAGATESDWIADGYVALLRQTLQSRHGDGGIGLIGLWRGEWTKTGVWSQITDFGLFSHCWSASNDAAKLWTLTVSEGDNIDLFYLRGAGYGAFDVVVDGGAAVTITPAGSADDSAQRANVSLGSEGAHTIVVKAPASGTLYFLGGAVYKGETGVVLHNIGNSSAVVGDLGYLAEKKLDIVSILAPRLHVVGFVANDFSAQQALGTYQAYQTAVITQIKLAGGDLMSWIPPDNDLTRAIPIGSYEAIARNVSADNGGCWLDIHRSWGDYSSNIARMYDTVHPNTLGHAAIHDTMLALFERMGG